MSRQLKEDLENIYENISVIGEKQSMTVGNTPVGDLPGDTKGKGPKGSGSENTDAKKEEEADANLQGDTVEKSKKGKGATSKFDELYNRVNSEVVSEELDDSGIESPSFNKEIGDFPPSGPDEETAERGEDEFGDAPTSLRELFGNLADIITQIGDKIAETEEGVGEGEIIDDETEMGSDEELAGEAVESTPAPKSNAKLQSKGNMNVKGVKVVKKSASSASSGQVDGGKPKPQPKSTLGPGTSLKANGSGAAVDGRDQSAFE
jgi:hypothetical protein